MNLENVADIYPLTPVQEGMLFHSIAGDASSGTYIDQVAFTISGKLDPQRLYESLQRVFGRYDVLRTAFIWDGVDQPLQVVREAVEYDAVHESWMEIAASEQASAFENLIRQEMAAGFELDEEPLIRVRTVALSETTWKLLLVFHHLILDGWSAHLLIRNLLSDYVGHEKADHDIFRFRDYVAWQGKQDQQLALDFWQQELAGFEKKNLIGSVDPRRPRSDSRFSECNLVISAEQSQTLREFSRSQRVTLNSLFVAGWSLTVSRYSGGTEDVVFGRTVAGRPAELHDAQSAIGNFINTLPFRTRLDPNQSVGSWLAELQASQNRHANYEFSSLAKIQQRSELPPGESLFDSILVFENYPAQDLEFNQVRVTNVEHFEHSNYALALLVVPRQDDIELLIVFDSDRYLSSFISRMLRFLRFKLLEICSSPSARLQELLSTIPDEAREELRSFFAPAQKIQSAETVVSLFQRAAASNAEEIAAVYGGESLTYRELDERSNQVASLLLENSVSENSSVGLCIERSFEMLIGIFGILKAGCYYVPLDTVYPREHFQYVLTDSNTAVVLTSTAKIDLLPELPDRETVCFEGLKDGSSSPFKLPRPEQTAYVIYTSGSTGQPKGVRISHQNLVESTLARTRYYSENPQCFLLLSSFAFDSSVAGIFWTLCTGGKLVMPVDEKDTVALCDLIEKEKVSHLLCLPILYQLILESSEKDEMSSLVAAIVAGDTVTKEVLEAHRQALQRDSGSWALFNEYGPTENSVWATVHQVDPGEPDVPIGKPICNTGVAIVDQHLELLPLGAIGEIALSGTGLSAGYIGEDELTQKKFKTSFDRFGESERIYLTGDLGYIGEDQCIRFCGRKDRQVKVRGYRVELGEIESVLSAVPGVVELAVVVQTNRQNQSTIVCYFTGSLPEDRNSWVSSIRNRLATFMIPDAFVRLEEMPRLPNGKIDRNALEPVSFATSSLSKVEPRTEVEKTLAQIWQEVLGIPQVGVLDEFFALGGDSILSIQVVSRARRSGLVIQPGDIGLYPRLEDLARHVSTNQEPTATAIGFDDHSLISPVQKWFFDQEFTNVNHWNLPQLFELSPGYDFDHLNQALQIVVNEHPVFRTRFQFDGENWSRQNSSETSDYSIKQFADGTKADLFELQRQLDINSGPLFKLGLLRNSGSNDLLLFVAHHLIIDLVSWQILIDDLEFVYAALLAGRPADLPKQTISYSQWVELNLAAAKESSASECQYWNSISIGDAQVIPNTFGTEGDARGLFRELGTELTDELLGSANQAFNTRPQELLLTALAQSMCEWRKAKRFVVELEHHGRHALNDQTDLSRVVGWFTATFPFELEFDGTDSNPSNVIKRIKEKFRAVPGQGIHYKALCHSGQVDQIQPVVLFNYHGSSRNQSARNLVSQIDGGLDGARDPANHRTHAIEINAWSTDRLQVSWRFNPELHPVELIDELSRQFISNLEKIVEYCRFASVEFTPSDFVESGLSQSELDDFLDDLE